MDICDLCGAVVCSHRHFNLSKQSRSGAIVTYTDPNSDLLGSRGSNPNLTPIANTLPAKSIDISDDWVNCNLCNNKVFIRYLDQHLKLHIHQHEAKRSLPLNDNQSSQSTSTALVRVADTTQSSGTSTSIWSRSEVKNEPKLQSLESYKFRKLDHVCAAGSVSKTESGRYSDFTVVFWGEEKTVVQNSNYYGHGTNSWTTKDWERLQIHLVYDSVENYYTVSCKLLRRSGYSSWDSDDCIPERVCYQHELMTTIKRALLFFKVDPKSAYRKFRKLFSSELVLTYDNDRALVAQTENCEELNKKLDSGYKYQGQTTYYNEHGSHGYSRDI